MIWILTTSYNDYSQHGAYFVDAWTSKPTEAQIKAHVSDWFCGVDVDPVKLLLETGGGRQCSEDQWFELGFK